MGSGGLHWFGTARLRVLGARAWSPESAFFCAYTCEMRCPQCGATIPVDPQWPTWCDQCGWNVVPQAPGSPDTRSAHDDRASARETALCEVICREPSGSVRRSGGARRLLALVITALLWVPAAALVVAAVLDAVYDRGAPRLLIPLACVAVAVVLRPRFGAVEQGAVSVSTTSAPQLFEVITRVATAAGAKSPSIVILDDSFGASYGVVGIRRRRVLSLGVPLWTVLDDSGKIALLAHQVAHDVDGDPLCTVVAGSVSEAPTTVHQVPAPDPYARGQHAANKYIERETTFRGVVAGTRTVARAARALRFRLLYPATRRSEYVADDIAARVASRAALSAYLDRTLVRDYANFALNEAAMRADEDLWARGRAMVSGIPPREMERLRRQALVRGDRVDDTHPPTALRQRFVDSRPSEPAQVSPYAGQFQATDEELRAAYAQVAADVLDRLIS